MSEQSIPLTVEAEDILPIIKRFLYTNREIFLRELISNAIDALAKLQTIRLSSKIDDDDEPLRVEILVDPFEKTVSILDNGIGMSKDEVLRYINQIAFSGAKEFIDQHAHSEVPLIGHFGLGFYSSFMVSKRVEIQTRSWRKEEPGCWWSCDGGTSTKVDDIQLERRGTRVTCYLEDDAEEFLQVERIENVIHYYLDYAPYPIFLQKRQINTVTAPWHLAKHERDELPSQHYWDIYNRLNPGDSHPLGWFHVESDFPVPVRALLFVPDRPRGDAGNLRLFANRTFVCDRCTELVAEWLGFMEGIIDCQDLPLNVGRDRFQRDPNVVKLSKHITSKCVDFLLNTFEKRRREFVRLWELYGEYLKSGYVKAVMEEQRSLAGKLEKLLLFPSSRKPLTTLDEYLERLSGGGKPTILYLTDLQTQHSHLEMLNSRNREVLHLTNALDPFLIQVLSKEKEDWSFVRVDQVDAIDSIETTISPSPADTIEKEMDWSPLLELFRATAGDSVHRVSIAKLPSRDIPVILSRTEEGVRHEAFSLFTASDNAAAVKGQLVLNSNCRLIQNLGRLGPRVAASRLPVELVTQIWTNLQMRSGLLDAEQLAGALRRNEDFLNLVIEQLTS